VAYKLLDSEKAPGLWVGHPQYLELLKELKQLHNVTN
jgi:hypothetical protein